MSVKAVYENEAEIPEQFKELYTKRGEKWEIQVEGTKTEEDVRRVQDVVRKLTEEKKELKTKLSAFGDLDAAALKNTLDEYEELKARAGTGKEGLTDEQLEEIVSKRINRIKNPLERELADAKAQLNAVMGERDGLLTEKNRTKLESAIRAAAMAKKVRPEAIEDVLRYMDEFEIGDKGVQIKNGDDAGEPPEVWFEKMASRRAHWWPEAQGAGSRGSNSVAGWTGPNPFAEGPGFNVTEQMRVAKRDEKNGTNFAEMLKKAASKK